MKTRAFLATTAAAALIFGAAATANAQSATVTGSYSASVSGVNGNAPTIGDELNSPFSESVATNGTPTSAAELISITPNNSCGSNCLSQHVTGNVAKADITTTFTGIEINGYAASVASGSQDDAIGVFYADYNSLSGSKGSGTDNYQSGLGTEGMDVCDANISAQTDTDCVNWGSSASNTSYDSDYTIDFTAIGGGELYTLAITLDAQEDWTIYPDYTFSLTQTPVGTPEPASMALFASGLVGLGAIRRRMTRKTPKAAA